MKGYEALLAGLIGVVLGSILAFLKDYIFERRRKNKELQYLSLIVAMHLDNFVEGCAEVVRDTGYRDERGELHSDSQHPKIQFTDLDVNWMSLPSGLMHDVLSFPKAIDSAHEYVLGACEYESFPPNHEEYFFARKNQFANLGIQAIDLAAKLRFHSGFPQPQESHFSSRAFLKKSLEETILAEKEYLKRRNISWANDTTVS